MPGLAWCNSCLGIVARQAPLMDRSQVQLLLAIACESAEWTAAHSRVLSQRRSDAGEPSRPGLRLLGDPAEHDGDCHEAENSGVKPVAVSSMRAPEHLRLPRYKTHMTGKWDAGMATWEHTPMGRGYDSFYGYFHHANDCASTPPRPPHELSRTHVIRHAAHAHTFAHRDARTTPVAAGTAGESVCSRLQ